MWRPNVCRGRGVAATDLSARARVNSGAGRRRGARVRFLKRHRHGSRGDSVRDRRQRDRERDMDWHRRGAGGACGCARRGAAAFGASPLAGSTFKACCRSTRPGRARCASQLAPGRNARGRVAVGGDLALTLRDGRWTLAGDPRVGGRRARQSSRQAGRLDGRHDLTATCRLGETDIPSLLGALRAAGIADAPADAVATGTVEGDVDLQWRHGRSLSSRTGANQRSLRGRSSRRASLTGVFDGRPLSQRWSSRSTRHRR